MSSTKEATVPSTANDLIPQPSELATSSAVNDEKDFAIEIERMKITTEPKQEKTNQVDDTTTSVSPSVASTISPVPSPSPSPSPVAATTSTPANLATSTGAAPFNPSTLPSVSDTGELLNGGYKRGGAENDPETGYYDEIEIEDMEYDEETSTYTYPCPCGDKFRITKVSHIILNRHIQSFSILSRPAILADLPLFLLTFFLSLIG